MLIRAALSDGSVNEALVKGYLDTSVPKGSKLLSTEYLADHCGLYYNVRTKTIEYKDGSTFGHANTSSGTPYLIGPKPGKQYRVNKSDFDPDAELSDAEGVGKAFITLKAFKIHRRLGYAGKPKTAATLENAKLIDAGDVITGMDFDCEACMIGKSTRQVSRSSQTRCQDAAWKFHMDTQPLTPKGLHGESY